MKLFKVKKPHFAQKGYEGFPVLPRRGTGAEGMYERVLQKIVCREKI